jgi:cation:H+ antiporter
VASVIGPVLFGIVGVAGTVWGAETFAEHLARASARLGVSTLARALALLLAGAEPEELATAVAATSRSMSAAVKARLISFKTSLGDDPDG